MNGPAKAEATLATSTPDITDSPKQPPQSSGTTRSPISPQDDIFVAAQYGDWQRIEKILQSGTAKATDKNEQGTTALHWAAINDRLLACKTLLDHGAEVNAIGGDLAATPMMWAAKNGHVYIVHLLVSYGGDPAMVDNQGYNVLQLATHSSNILLILYLLHIDCPVDSLDPQGHTCLMWAAYQGDALSVDAFLRWGANVNAKDHDGLHALHWSVVRGNKQCIKRVIEEGGDLSAKQNEDKDSRALAKELKTIKAFEGALESVGRDSDTGLNHTQLFSMDLSMKFIFLLPHIYLGIVLQLFSKAPIVLSIPANALFLFAFHKLSASVITPPSIRQSGIHKTPYLAGIFSASAFWTTLHWIFVILPSIGNIYPIWNFVFGIIFATCMYHFFTALLKDPGFIPRTGGRTEQREAIEELIREGEYDNQHFCIECLVRKPLRSKHCRICRRCVARHDHHCPWVNNCVGVRNHKNFMIYIFALFIGIPIYAYLTSLHIKYSGRATNPVECIVLADEYCAWIQIDGFGTYLAAWDCLQMTWISMLVLVQSWQIARATTTQEVVNMRRHGYMGGASEKRRVPVAAQIASVIAAGTTDPEAAALDDHGHGPDCGHDHHRRNTGGVMQKITRLLGVDQFVDTAKEGIAGRKGGKRRKKANNPFDGGATSNCTDFWRKRPVSDAGDGAGLVKAQPVDFYKLYEMPNVVSEMYSSVPTADIV